MAPTRSCVLFIAISAILSPALAQSSQFTTTSSSATTATSSASPTSTVSTDATDAFWFPLLGISDNPFLDWGVNISRLSDVSLDPPQVIQYEIVVNSNTSTGSYAREVIYYEGNNSTATTQPADSSLSFVSNGDNALTLGAGSNLTFAANGQNQSVPTVPFGFNIGNRESWNGSVVLGGSYDANRVASTSWFLLPGTDSSNSTFLQSGTQSTQIDIKSPSQSMTASATLDLNNDAIILPSTFNCSQEFGILFKSPSDSNTVLEISVPTNLTRSPFRCKLAATANATIVLGRPFFQVAYAYLTEEGSMYLAAAHQYELPIDAKPFDANATLVPAASPLPAATSPTASSNAGASVFSDRNTLQPIVISAGLMIFSLMSSLAYFNV